MSDVKTAKKLADRQGSNVQISDGSGQVYKGLHVWCDCAPSIKTDPDLMFAKCLVLPGSTKEKLQLRQVDPEDRNNTTFEAKQGQVYNMNSNIDPMVYPDIGMIPHTNVAAVLDFIRQRFVRGQIYTTADPLLLAMNPFKDLGNTTQAVIVQYRDAFDVYKLPPHVFTVARQALESLHGVKKSQTIIVSGESGAGKTEATKQIMRYFAAAKSGNMDLRVQKAVLAGNPVLEAMGNAKTVRNNNSSRFGRFMQLQVAAAGGIEFGNVRNFLLEMSRIIHQDAAERSYHIFYQCLCGMSAADKQKYGMLGLNDYRTINAKAAKVDGMDDVAEFKETHDSFISMGMSPQDLDGIFRCISAVMLLGNVEIKGENREGVPDAAVIGNAAVFSKACELLGIDRKLAEEALLLKITNVQGKDIRGVFTNSECVVLKDSMSKAIYNSLFNWIVSKLNMNIKPADGEFKLFIGMLDIFGFEVFENNSLEQLFINITNEMLQKNFVDIVFDREIKLYAAEGISSANLTWTTNKPIIDLLFGKKNSIISFLEDSCLAPGGADTKFLSAVAQSLGTHPNFAKSKMGSNTNFIITHTIGDIQYCVDGFVMKNRDMIKPELVDVMQQSTLAVTAALFKDVKVEKGKIGKDQLISSQFLTQLHELMALINQTEPHFVRCLKPNEEKAALKFIPSKVLVQLHALSILEALQLRNLGYSYRRPFEEFNVQFKFLDVGVSEDPSIPPKDKSVTLLQGSGLTDKDFQIGHTMVFLKHDAVKYLTLRQRELMAAWEPLVSALEAMYKSYAVRQEIKHKLQSIIRVQAHIRANAIRG